MENKGGNVSVSCIGFTQLLTIVFIVLKLLGKITWSWVWVLCPLWAPIALAILIVILVLLISLMK